MYIYSDPSRADDPYALPDCEVFYAEPGEIPFPDEPGFYPRGWYFAFGSPGCLHEGEPEGPYASEAEAIAAARDLVADGL